MFKQDAQYKTQHFLRLRKVEAELKSKICHAKYMKNPKNLSLKYMKNPRKIAFLTDPTPLEQVPPHNISEKISFPSAKKRTYKL